MRKHLILGTAAALSLALVGTASADTDVQSLTGDWSTSNSTVTKVADGVHFGTYADGGAIGGSVLYNGANGSKLSDVNDFSYTFTYRQAGNTMGAAPYARIFLDNDLTSDTNGDGNPANDRDTDVVLDPSYCATQTPLQGIDLTYQMVGNSVRYDDDACNGAPAPGQQDWNDVVAAHGDEHISAIAVTQGFSSGTDVSAMLSQITFNGTTFAFNVAPADGVDGAKGDTGNTGAAGPKGDTGASGATGAAGKDGVTTIIHDNGTLAGNTMRTIHAPRIKGMTFISARASLLGKAVQTHGRTIKVDLRAKTAGEYRVFITAKYKANGKTYKVRSIRSLSITRN